LLLLCVFALVHVSVLRLRRDPVDHPHFCAPSWLPVVGVIACAALVVQRAVDAPADVGRAAALVALGAMLSALPRRHGRRASGGRANAPVAL
jgi:basic amino acid/polyamine antiporter, APA family